MKTTLFILTITILAAASIPADAQLIEPISQTRTVAGTAFGEDFSGSLNDADADQAPGFDPFQGAVSADVSLDSVFSSGGANQNSEIRSNSIVAQGAAFASAEAFDFDAFADASGESRTTIAFTLTVESDFTLTGAIAAYDNGVTDLDLTDATGAIFTVTAASPISEIPISTSGTLAAGDYTLHIRADGNAFGDVDTFGYAFGEYMVTLQFAGSGPGGEVPDGADVAGGPPLTLERLAGDQVELAWSPSCRAEDVDYAVYEGDLAAPGALMPVSCTTGGARQQVVTPLFSGSYFIVVPTDGATEGSYGDTSAGVERMASGVACRPQSLGLPVCP